MKCHPGLDAQVSRMGQTYNLNVFQVGLLPTELFFLFACKIGVLQWG